MKIDKEMNAIRNEVLELFREKQLSFGEIIILLESIKYITMYELEWDTLCMVDNSLENRK
jgi:hypothetical protein